MTDPVFVSQQMIEAARAQAPELNQIAIQRLLEVGLTHRRETMKEAYLIAPSLRPSTVEAMLEAAQAAMAR